MKLPFLDAQSIHCLLPLFLLIHLASSEARCHTEAVQRNSTFMIAVLETISYTITVLVDFVAYS